MHLRHFALAILLLPVVLFAQKKDNRSGYDRSAKATVLHTANVYATADTSAPPLVTVTAGHEVVVLEHNGPWVRVFANTDAKDREDDDSVPEFTEDTSDPSTGWIHDKGIVGPTTPNGDALIYGLAAELEAKAAEPHAPKGAAEAAHLLYRRVSDYFPQSPLAAEAAFRSADIRWQIDKADISTLPSAREQEAYLRPQLYEGEFKRVMKLFPNTPFAARAAFALLDNKLCGDWQGLPKCPEMESGLYEKYAERYQGGPKSAEALYNAAYRQGVLVTMYQVEENQRRADAAAKNCEAIAQQMRARYPQSDYTPRAESIAFRVKQGISVYGNDRD
ncbi:MAG: SH3 domain-containing protein [Acidobacteriota bacterium]|nr:SH3 domain-containing protein [Acidobacteriota bacterium]